MSALKLFSLRALGGAMSTEDRIYWTVVAFLAWPPSWARCASAFMVSRYMVNLARYVYLTLCGSKFALRHFAYHPAFNVWLVLVTALARRQVAE